MAARLEVRGLCKSYPGVRALDGVDFTLAAGEVHALLGENGAGKSTLIKTVTGAVARDGGTVHLDGRAIEARDPADAVRHGIATVYQEVNLLPNLSVAANIGLGREPTRFGLIRRGELRRRAQALLTDFGLDIDVSERLDHYSVAIQQLVAIARAVDLSAQVLILDEPTASLDSEEVALLFRVVRSLKARGIGIIFVTHFLDQVYELADRVTILRNGRLVGERPIGELSRSELVAMMLGRALTEETGQREATPPPTGGTPAVAFNDYGKARLIAPFNLALHAGEVVGMAGLLGSGRTETAKLLFGVERADQGTARLAGRPVTIQSPREAIRLGFAYCPEERKTEGIVGALSVRENIILALQARRGWLKPLSRREQNELAERFIKSLDIRTSDAERPIETLSGGNQQKALLARWLATEPRFLILDEPTRGIDVGAHAEIIRLIRRLCAEGLALLVISSELEEIVAYADRVVVLRDRAHVGEITGDQLNVDAIVATIAQHGTQAA